MLTVCASYVLAAPPSPTALDANSPIAPEKFTGRAIDATPPDSSALVLSPAVSSADSTAEPPFDIILLPSYVVRPEELPKFTLSDLSDTQGRLTIALQRYVSPFNRKVLNRYRLPIIGDGIDQYALQMYEDDERIRAMSKFSETVITYRLTGDKISAALLEDELQSMFMRRTDFRFPSRRRP